MGNQLTMFLQGFKQTKNKKQLWIILILGIVLLLAAPSAGTKKSPKTDQTTKTDGREYLSQLETKLEKTLERVEGAGHITVLLTPKSSGKKSIAKDSKSNRSDTDWNAEETVVLSGDDTPVVIEEYYPVAGGALIVAEGAGNEQIRNNLKRAASAVLQIGINRIEVLEGR